jgi:ABC-type Fe2+-enterobactin transport system substrate-binding protein
MGANLYYKKYIEKLITANPEAIIITRTTTTDDGYGGKTENKSTLPPQTVTFYKRKSHREFVSDTGQTVGYLTSSIEKILTKFDADIQKGDIFPNQGRIYKVTFVNTFLDICKQVELEVIK